MSTLKTDTIVDVDGLGAPSFPNGLSGSASLLTGLPSSQLTGALPAISGAALTNLPSQTPSTTGGAVGTYGFFYKDNQTAYDFGVGGQAGNRLYPTSVGANQGSGQPAGTWQCMGFAPNNNAEANVKCLWVRTI